MRNSQSLITVSLLFSSVVALISAKISSNRYSKWQTLSGNAPLVVARGGFSGLLPDSSENAYQFAVSTSLLNLISWCDVQLTKDGAGICFPDVRLDIASDIDRFFPNKSRTYIVDGDSKQGWFSVDYTLHDLKNISLKQAIYSRTDGFDKNLLPILEVRKVAEIAKPSSLWLNIQHDSFFSQHNLSMRNFVISVSRSVVVDYISSPEVNFLRSIQARFRRCSTKLILQFLGQDDIEPSINQTYSSLLKNLTFIKTFASGILIPKNYVWPVDHSQYLQPHTSVVLDAHEEGLEVFASGFANDATFAYNYSYDPVAEYISFIDNGNFSVDGVLSDFPNTPSAAIDCFSHMGHKEALEAKLLIISSEGASGDYPGCTDLAYTRAVSSNVDVLDCPVQMTKDGIPICLGSINLMDRTTVDQSSFSNLSTDVPELGTGNGIFTFNLNWSELRRLTPAISNPWSNFTLYRNPKFRNSGKLMSFSDFLALAKYSPSVSGVLISIEHAAYLAGKQGLNVVDVVLKSLNEAGYNDQTIKKVMIQSTDSSVLEKFKEKRNYELVYMVNENIRDVQKSTIMKIKEFAKSVVISKNSVYPADKAFLTSTSDVVPKLQACNLSVYVQLFSNEFASQAWDFFADAYLEINTYVNAIGINGLVTDFPATAAKYRLFMKYWMDIVLKMQDFFTSHNEHLMSW
ncbi:glycerophosphodiester phosphodiesterase GDPDL3-like isoform X2 [Olea europaea var. sylvestris]|uniref:glycerophosphodiester phosphodiesterase GDPDL3-like isoform X2 n=1 Tax=Olea europaea var. sylvestris TaxID=158386 RepID=UPI000C1D4F6E|nr:glycerophosphodiester phosphodiesterase GDPDL3-like isoform X2 [Olea europaea var. sylvestris]